MTRKGGLIGRRRDARRIAAARMKANGKTVKAIASRLGCSAGTVYELLREAKEESERA